LQNRRILISASGLVGGVFLLLSWAVLKGTRGCRALDPFLERHLPCKYCHKAARRTLLWGAAQI